MRHLTRWFVAHIFALAECALLAVLVVGHQVTWLVLGAVVLLALVCYADGMEAGIHMASGRRRRDA